MRKRINFPRVRRVRVRNFSIYAQELEIDVPIGQGVTCLAGANGLGKSTFLSLLNYGLTGAVPATDRGFKSAKEYYRDALRFTDDYFQGRISEDDRETAEVELNIEILDGELRIVRGFFEPGLRELDWLDTPETSELSSEPDIDRDSAYRAAAVQATGLASFEQYVFLQHFVFTFDESRHLLFWDERALEYALYLAFGADHGDAAKAEQLRRDMEKAASMGRNYKFDATGVMKRIRTIEEAFEIDVSPELESVVEDYKAFVEAQEEAEEKAEELEVRLLDVRLQETEAAARLVELRNSYEEQFHAGFADSRQGFSHNPLLMQLKSGVCPFCGQDETNHLAAAITKAESGVCPICATNVPQKPMVDDEWISRLEALDSEIAEATKALSAEQERRARLTEELKTARRGAQVLQQQVREMEQRHEQTLAAASARNEADGRGLTQILQELRDQHRRYLALRRDAYGKRDEYKAELRVLQEKLEAHYAEAEEEFVPLFKRLAQVFLGMDLDISLQTSESPAIGLVAELKSTKRRRMFDLSESQRFFIDIALRMAFVQYLSKPNFPAPLVIDTPEGSLDIAYENKAGEMFADYVRQGYHLVMTANINTSRLLINMARLCGMNFMVVHEMTQWAELSDVQEEQMSLFSEALRNIEKELQAASV